jgi:hypothetical protein
MKRTFWHNDATPVENTLDQVMFEIKFDDIEGLLLDSVSLADIIEDSDGLMAFDALVTPYARLPARMDVLLRVMMRSGTTVQPLNVQCSEPFMQNGTANVAAIFELSDGQTISIFFHNPDTTPKKILPTDELISWKWLLNKKDITIVVAPERNLDLNPRQVAARIMKLAEKNSASFVRSNGKRAERMQALEDLKTEITGLEGDLKGALHRLEIAKVEKEDRDMAVVEPVIEPVVNTEEIEPVVEPEVIEPIVDPAIDPVNVDGLDYTPIDLSADQTKQAWDKAISETDGNEFEAAKNVYKNTLQGHYVNTSIGKVLISGHGWRKIKEHLKNDSLRAKAVPYIAMILKEGSVGVFDPNNKVDKKPDVIGYYPFTKTLEIDKKLVTAVLKVEQKEKGEFVYYLDPSEDGILDSTNENASLLRFQPDSLAFQRSEIPTLDSSVEPNTGGVNIIILKVTDLEGNEITELEDSIDTDPELTATEEETNEQALGIDADIFCKDIIDSPLSSAELKKVAGAYFRVQNRGPLTIDEVAEFRQFYSTTKGNNLIIALAGPTKIHAISETMEYLILHFKTKHYGYEQTNEQTEVETETEAAGTEGGLIDQGNISDDDHITRAVNNANRMRLTGKERRESILEDVADYFSMTKDEVAELPNVKKALASRLPKQAGLNDLNIEVTELNQVESGDGVNKAEIEKELENLKPLIGTRAFDDKIDPLIEKIFAAGTMPDYEPQLVELDRLHGNAKVANNRGL